ncbi:hypothetical protein RhiirA4_468213 [Rhizophagus irregularis]|uniref:Uncharacterized protein n=1 Tax=Rhizophagus irregularis TaxID=588596 RepID=A0A2I1GXM7_9GLOM|nr:hypothetical protein RhiirA4_468213 [Rhizophagus irregularis]
MRIRKFQQNTAPNETKAASKYLFTELHHVTIFYLCFSLLQLGERERGHGHGRCYVLTSKSKRRKTVKEK